MGYGSEGMEVGEINFNGKKNLMMILRKLLYISKKIYTGFT